MNAGKHPYVERIRGLHLAETEFSLGHEQDAYIPTVGLGILQR